jgi:microcystin-dependent protein
MDYQLVLDSVNNQTGHLIQMSGFAFVLAKIGMDALAYQDAWVDGDGNPVDDTTWDIIDNWISTALHEFSSDYTCPGGGDMVTGVISFTATGSVPAGYLLCDGSQYLRTAYPDLYAALDSAFIIDADNFVVPDLREVFVLGAGPVHSVGDTGGEASHTLTIDEIPEHAHVVYRASSIGTASTRVAGGASNTIGATATTAVGGGLAHNNMPPFNTLLPVIKT